MMTDDEGWCLEVRRRVAGAEPLPETSLEGLERLAERRRNQHVYRPKRGDWVVIWRRGERVAFDSRWVSVELRTERGARWLAALVRTALDAGVFAPPKGANVPPPHRPPIEWRQQGDPSFDDDSVCRHGPFVGQVEWLNGPEGKGGEYWFGVWCSPPTAAGFADFHWTELLGDVQARSADAGRFLAELIMDVAAAGRPIPSIADPPQT